MSDGTPNAAAVITRGLSELGWAEGKNVQFVWRSAEGRFGRLPAIFEELVALPVDVIVAIGPGAVEAAKITRTTPIVMAASAGAVNIGLAASLGRPATNVTGLSFEVPPDLEGKRLALLKQSLPRISRVAILSEGGESGAIPKSIRDAASALDMKVIHVGFASLGEIEGAIANAAKQGADALLVMDGVWVHRRSYQLMINTHAIRYKLPVMHTALGGAEAGGVLAYGIDTLDQYRRIPYFIDRILRGARPADLPIEQPQTFTLAVNLDTARALGLTIPPNVMVQADRVIDTSRSGRR